MDEAASPRTSDEAALETLWGPRGMHVADLSIETDGTIAASAQRGASSRARARGQLPSRPEGAADEREIALAAELGRGGMGVVSIGTQRSLRREVAVKQTIEAGSDGADLVEEAWVLAHLAHPNVVPVHALAYLGGRPAVVMKRIGGTPWSELLRAEPGSIERGTSVPAHPIALEDPLGFHLRTLVEVARAIEHAHSAGVLHLDLKPQNVMVGDLGEVYVLDWGLAARIGAEPAWLAPATSIDSVAGTPEYMAPELAMALGAQIDERTDVYLLGAILHEILTGRPRHEGASPIQRLFRACLSEPPPYGVGVPPELAALARAATARNPAQRPASARAFVEAIEAALRHREAGTLYQRALGEEQLLARALERETADRAEIHARFGGARFASREARALRPDLAEAAALERRLHVAMARFALREGEVGLAESYAAGIEGGDPEIAAAIEAAKSSAAARAARLRRLERLAQEEDLGAGRVIRSAVTFLLALTFLAVNLAMGWIERSGLHAFGYLDMFFAALGGTILGAPAVWARRRQLFPNRAGGSIWAVVLCGLAVAQGHWALSYALGVRFRASFALTPVIYTLCFGAMATLLDARLWPAAILQVPTALLAAAYPEWAYEIVGAGGAISVIYLAVIWTERAIATRRVRPEVA